MTSETDHPRQRTVAELLAEHGNAAPTGGRRRRRAPDGPDDVESTSGRYTPQAPPPTDYPPRSAPSVEGRGGRGADYPAADDYPPAVPDRRVLREPVPYEPGPRDYPPEPPARAPEARRAPEAYADRPPREQPREQRRDLPTDRMPRFRDEAAAAGRRAAPMAPGRAPLRRPDDAPPPRHDDSQPTMIGAPPQGAEAWHQSRTGHRRPMVDDDGGPPTQAGGGPLDFDDRPAGLDDDGPLRDQDLDDDYDDDYDDYDDDDVADQDDDDDDHDDERPARRRERPAAPASSSQAWAAVGAQWIVGAIGGAALWVGFRFLWRDLPVVAIAAAVLVTVGLVVVVRQLLRSNDMRTTIFAVLVGLLLTVSPVILILLGR